MRCELNLGPSDTLYTDSLRKRKIFSNIWRSQGLNLWFTLQSMHSSCSFKNIVDSVAYETFWKPKSKKWIFIRVERGLSFQNVVVGSISLSPYPCKCRALGNVHQGMSYKTIYKMKLIKLKPQLRKIQIKRKPRMATSIFLSWILDCLAISSVGEEGTWPENWGGEG